MLISNVFVPTYGMISLSDLKEPSLTSEQGNSFPFKFISTENSLKATGYSSLVILKTTVMSIGQTLSNRYCTSYVEPAVIAGGKFWITSIFSMGFAANAGCASKKSAITTIPIPISFLNLFAS